MSEFILNNLVINKIFNKYAKLESSIFIFKYYSFIFFEKIVVQTSYLCYINKCLKEVPWCSG